MWCIILTNLQMLNHPCIPGTNLTSWWYMILFNFFFQRLFIFGTERDRAWTGEGQKERETQNWKQAPGSKPSAQSLTRGSNSRTARSWPGRSRTLNRLRHPGAPEIVIFKGMCVSEEGAEREGDTESEASPSLFHSCELMNPLDCLPDFRLRMSWLLPLQTSPQPTKYWCAAPAPHPESKILHSRL